MESSITVGVDVPQGNGKPVTPVTPVTPTEPQSGKGPDTSSKRARKRDTPPRTQPRKAVPVVNSDDTFDKAAVKQALTELLSMPAIPCGMMGDEWAASHFLAQGPALAEQLAEHAEKNPAIAKWCIRLTQGESALALLMAGTMYAVPPMLHWGIIPAPPAAKAVLGVPVKAPDNSEDGHPMGNSSNTSNGSHAQPGVA